MQATERTDIMTCIITVHGKMFWLQSFTREVCPIRSRNFHVETDSHHEEKFSVIHRRYIKLKYA